MNELLHLGVPWWALVVRSVAIYVVLLIGLRIFGKREVGQFTIFDLVLILLVANAVQPAMTGPDSSLLGGVIIVASLLAANFIVARLNEVPLLKPLFTASPAVLVVDGKVDEKVMKEEGIDPDELMMEVREHGLEKLEEVHLAVIESDGSISIVGKDSAKAPSRRHRRRRFRRRA